MSCATHVQRSRSRPSERRESPRFELKAPVILRHILATGKTAPVVGARVRNVGNGGIQVHLGRPLPEGSLVDLSFHLPAHARFTRLLGLVRWSRKASMGIQFFYSTDLERDRIVRSLCALERTGAIEHAA